MNQPEQAQPEAPQVIKNKIVAEANWRATNGHGGVDDITRDNFILAAEYGYGLSQPEAGEGQRLQDALKEIERLKGLIEKLSKDFLWIYHQPKAGYKLQDILEMEIEAGWQQYKSENNL